MSHLRPQPWRTGILERDSHQLLFLPMTRQETLGFRGTAVTSGKAAAVGDCIAGKLYDVVYSPRRVRHKVRKAGLFRRIFLGSKPHRSQALTHLASAGELWIVWSSRLLR